MTTAPEPTHVLFVDDQPEVLAGLRTSLHRERRHFVGHYATDAYGARTALAEHPITVLVTDLKMPSTDGIEVLHQLLLDQAGSAAPDLVASREACSAPNVTVSSGSSAMVRIATVRERLNAPEGPSGSAAIGALPYGTQEAAAAAVDSGSSSSK